MADKDELRILQKELDYYLTVENSVSDDVLWELEVPFPVPGNLKGLVYGPQVLKSEVAREELHVVGYGDHSRGYYEQLLEAVDKSLQYYQQLEQRLPQDEHWRIARHEHPKIVDGRPWLSMPSEILSKEKERLEAKLASIHPNV